MASYFTPGFFSFFDELELNNSSEWFQTNRKRYETEVKVPFHRFITDLLSEIKTRDANIQIEAKDCIFRINRDIRFSANKNPYKNNVAANISPAGKKSAGYPGFYIHAGSQEVMIGGGVYDPDKEQLHRIRWHILHHPKEFHKIIQDKKFVSFFGEMLGDKNKILPVEYKEAVHNIPLLAHKQFYFMRHLSREEWLDKSLMKNILKGYETAQGLSQFLSAALNQK